MSRHETFRAADRGRAELQAVASARPLPDPVIAVVGAGRWRKVRLWTELVGLFLGLPLLMTGYFDHLIATVGGFCLIFLLALLAGTAAVLLAITPGFRFERLLKGPVLREWRLILVYVALAGTVCVAGALALVPGRFLILPLNHTVLWVIVLAAYPVLSALPQEIIYRVLFFERYGSLFPGTLVAAAANGLIFSFGHLFYLNAVTLVTTAVGGALIGWAYLTRGRSMLLSWVLHSVAGWLIFTSGLGIYFYSGGAGPLT